MPYPTPYDVPEEARKMALYQSLLGMGSQMLQPKPYKTGLMGDIGNVFGAANQGMSNMGSLLGSYQKTLQEQEAMKLKQAEDMRQQQMQAAQIPLIQAQTQNQLRQAQPEQRVPFNGTDVPLSKFSSLLGAVTGAQEQARKAKESSDTGIGMQNLGILQNLPANIGGMSPEDAAIAKGSIQEQAMRYAPKETQEYLKGMKEKEFNIPGDLDSFLAGKAGQYNIDYSIPQGRMTMLKLYGDNNTGLMKEFQAWKPSLAPNIVNVVPTSEGMLPISGRTGKQVGAPIGGKTLPSEQITAQQQIGTLKETISQIKELYKPEYIGPIAGRVAEIKESTVGIPEDQAKFNAATAQAQNTLVYLMSGKQINEQEYERLKRQLPDKNLPESVFKARLNEFERTLDSIIQQRASASGGYGKNIKGGSQPTEFNIGNYKVRVK